MSRTGRHAGSGETTFSERQLRDALAQFATGVAIVCARAPDERCRAASKREFHPLGRQGGGDAPSVGVLSKRYVGFTANSFSSASLDPPLVLWTLAQRSSSLAAFEASPRYAVNVLSAGQIELARRFSRPHADRFANVSFRLGSSDAPLIDGCVAWFECRHHAQHRIGDHMLFVGEVVTVERARGHGLVFQHGHYGSIATLPRKNDSKR